MIKMRNDVIILGRPIQLQERKKAQMKGVTIGDSLAYKFFDGEYHGMSLLFAEPKKGSSTTKFGHYSKQSRITVQTSCRIPAAKLSSL